jgi:hypothetical protein
MSNAQQELEGGEPHSPLHDQSDRSAVAEAAITVANADQSAEQSVQPQSSSFGSEVAGAAAISSAVETSSKVIQSFGFVNPFQGAAAVQSAVMFPPASQSTVLVSNPPPSDGVSGFNQIGSDNFSALSAEQLVDKLRAKIPALDREAWKSLGLDGSCILEVSSPTTLSGQLTDYLGLTGLNRDRTAAAIKKMIIEDTSIDLDIRKMWGFLPPAPIVSIQDHTANSRANPVDIHSTPPNKHQIVEVSSGSANPQFSSRAFAQAVSPLQPSFLFAGTAHANCGGVFRAEGDQPKFLSEVSERASFPMGHAVDQHESNQTMSMIPHAGGSTSAAAGSAGSMQNIQITLHQPTQQTYNWMILENLENRAYFMKWIKKNRREQVLSDKANWRSLTSLLDVEVRHDVIRTLATYPQVFNTPKPITSYADVTEELLLYVLFFKFGPRNAIAAKARLSEVKFRFDDSTTYQDRFAPKLRRWCSEWRQTLLDFKYTCKLWPVEDDLLHENIVDAFLSCFQIEDEIIGPDKRTKVPKCASMQAIRDMIRDNKKLNCDAIINIVTRRFENVDATIRSDPLIKHSTTPWKTEGTYNARKRKFSQHKAESADKRRQDRADAQDKRPPYSFPRCNNCGSKGHRCTERTCYFWGHPSAKGPKGDWPEGTPSLRLTDDEMAEWKTQRYDIFYSYDENKKTPKSVKPKQKFGANKGINKK